MNIWRVAVSLSGEDDNLVTVALVPARTEHEAFTHGVRSCEQAVGKLGQYMAGYWTVEQVAHTHDCAEFAREMFSEAAQRTMDILARTREEKRQ